MLADRRHEWVGLLGAENGELLRESALDWRLACRLSMGSVLASHPDGRVGGVKQSGGGDEMFAEAVDCYTQLQSITVHPPRTAVTEKKGNPHAH